MDLKRPPSQKHCTIVFMKLAMIGLGRMGGNMVRRLLRAGHEVVVYDRDPAAVQQISTEGAIGASSLADLASKLTAPKVAWMMVPSGGPTEGLTTELSSLFSAGDVVVDGANSNWKDSVRRAKSLEEKGILWVDAGTSGGVWGLENGYCLMVGGTPEAFAIVEPALKSLAPEEGYSHVGKPGAGHYVKMVHNGIEYGLLQAYAEGFELLRTSPFSPNLHTIAKLWGKGSVVRSWLLELAERAFGADPELQQIKGYIDDSGTGRWTVEASIEQSVPAPVLTLSLQMRFRSRQDDSFGAKVIAALRNQFGGHAVKKG